MITLHTEDHFSLRSKEVKRMAIRTVLVGLLVAVCLIGIYFYMFMRKVSSMYLNLPAE